MDEYPEVRKIAEANAEERLGFAGKSRVVLRSVLAYAHSSDQRHD